MEVIYFHNLSSDELRQWVQAHPGHIEDLDKDGDTALYSTAFYKKDLALVQWLIDTQGAGANGRTSGGRTALHEAGTLPILQALLERGADPTLLDNYGWTALINQAYRGRAYIIACLLEDRRRPRRGPGHQLSRRARTHGVGQGRHARKRPDCRHAAAARGLGKHCRPARGHAAHVGLPRRPRRGSGTSSPVFPRHHRPRGQPAPKRVVLRLSRGRDRLCQTLVGA